MESNSEHLEPGDTINVELGEDGATGVSQPSVRERLAPLIGIYRRGKGLTIDEINAQVRWLRGREDDVD
jgi:hypothetical protein